MTWDERTETGQLKNCAACGRWMSATAASLWFCGSPCQDRWYHKPPEPEPAVVARQPFLY